MAAQVAVVRVNIDPQGRVVIPVELRRALNLESGETLVARVSGEQLVLERPAHMLAMAKARFTHLRGGPSLADELVAERKLDAALEDAEVNT